MAREWKSGQDDCRHVHEDGQSAAQSQQAGSQISSSAGALPGGWERNYGTPMNGGVDAIGHAAVDKEAQRYGVRMLLAPSTIIADVRGEHLLRECFGSTQVPFDHMTRG